MPVRKKILYLMHVDWGWAKQRPHFIAEQLSDCHDVLVGHKYSFRKAGLSESGRAGRKIRFKRIYVLPFSRFKIVALLNSVMAKVQLLRQVWLADVVWVTHPRMFECVRGALRKETRLIYDCMDDALEFPDALSDQRKLQNLMSLEKDLVFRSNRVICSSNYLKSKISGRCVARDENIIVINNAINIYDFANNRADEEPPYSLQKLRSIEGQKVLYVGTISSWLDFEIVMESLARFENIRYVLIGPCEVEVPKHERLFLLPPVEHRYVLDLMRAANALVMPFYVNELVKSVNPVKLYEYIHSERPALVVGYEETEPFRDHVYIYNSKEEYYSYLEMLSSGVLPAKSSHVSASEFIRQNTWSMRAKKIFPLLEG